MVYKIYISTTQSNQEYLATIQQALFAINEVALPALDTPEIPIFKDKRQILAQGLIQESNVFIGLYDEHYGTVPEGETQSHIELEYQQAVELGKDILIFMMEDALANADERQQAFLDYVRQRQVITTFTDEEDLAAKVKLALDKYHETVRHRRRLRPPVSNLRNPLPALSVEEQTTDIDKEATSEEQFADMVERAMLLAEDNIEQIIRRALELHNAQEKIQSQPSEEFDNKITVEPLWGEPIRRSQFQSDIFMIMPFRDKYNAIFERVVRPITADLNLTIKRGDEFSSTRGSIMQEVWAALNACKLVIVETTEINANVYYELGIAHTLGKPAILLTQTKDVEELPFDIRHLRFLVYEDSIEGSADLAERLRKTIIWLLNDIEEQSPLEE